MLKLEKHLEDFLTFEVPTQHILMTFSPLKQINVCFDRAKKKKKMPASLERSGNGIH